MQEGCLFSKRDLLSFPVASMAFDEPVTPALAKCLSFLSPHLLLFTYLLLTGFRLRRDPGNMRLSSEEDVHKKGNLVSGCFTGIFRMRFLIFFRLVFSRVFAFLPYFPAEVYTVTIGPLSVLSTRKRNQIVFVRFRHVGNPREVSSLVDERIAGRSKSQGTKSPSKE
jgi:hypothetical protein